MRVQFTKPDNQDGYPNPVNACANPFRRGRTHSRAAEPETASQHAIIPWWSSGIPPLRLQYLCVEWFYFFICRLLSPMNVQRGSSRPSDGLLRGKLSCQLHL